MGKVGSEPEEMAYQGTENVFGASLVFLHCLKEQGATQGPHVLFVEHRWGAGPGKEARDLLSVVRSVWSQIIKESKVHKELLTETVSSDLCKVIVVRSVCRLAPKDAC